MKGNNKISGKLFGSLCAIVTFIGLVALGLSSPVETYAAEKAVSLEFISAMAAQFPVTILFQDWAKQVEKKTGGAIKITVHPMGTLVAPPQGYDSVVKGIADMAWHPDSFTPGRFPMTELLDLPTGAGDNITASKMANEYYNKFKPREFNDVYMLFIGMSPPNYIHTKKPVKTVEDLKGMKIKTLGSTQSDYITALGAVPVAMPTPEVYDSISKGVIEGFVGTYEAMMTFKLNEVTPYTVESPHTTFSTAAFLVANKKKWDSIPPDSKKILDQMIKELELQVPKVFGEQNKRSKESALKAGHHVTTLPAAEDEKWAARVKPVLDKEVKDRIAKGLPAQDALNFIQDNLKKGKR